MAVKYTCSKCSKRFVDWGADKIKSGEGCDDCKGEFLELVAFDASKPAPKKKPTLKRKRRAKAAAPVLPPEDVDSAPNDVGLDAEESPVPEAATTED